MADYSNTSEMAWLQFTKKKEAPAKNDVEDETLEEE